MRQRWWLLSGTKKWSTFQKKTDPQTVAFSNLPLSFISYNTGTKPLCRVFRPPCPAPILHYQFFLMSPYLPRVRSSLTFGLHLHSAFLNSVWAPPQGLFYSQAPPVRKAHRTRSFGSFRSWVPPTVGLYVNSYSSFTIVNQDDYKFYLNFPQRFGDQTAIFNMIVF